MARAAKRSKHPSSLAPSGDPPAGSSGHEAALFRRVTAYAALGGAAALGGGDAQAGISFTDIPDVTLDTTGATFDLDFDGDALAELQFRSSLRTFQNGGTSTYDPYYTEYRNDQTVVPVTPGPTGRFLPNESPQLFQTLVLDPGDEIGPGGSFSLGFGAQLARWWYSSGPYYRDHYDSGFFREVESGFLGVRFDLGDDTHFGWVQLTTGPDATFTRIEAWAWQTTPGESILAGQTVPEPSTLSLLALGVVGSMGVGWRRSRERSR